MIPLLVLGALLLLVLLYVGARLLWAGHQLDRLPAPAAPTGTVAAKVDARLQRARSAVETLVMPEVQEDELQPSPGAFRDRAQTYVVLGTAMLGLAAVLVIGVLLLL